MAGILIAILDDEEKKLGVMDLLERNLCQIIQLPDQGTSMLYGEARILTNVF